MKIFGLTKPSLKRRIILLVSLLLFIVCGLLYIKIQGDQRNAALKSYSSSTENVINLHSIQLIDSLEKFRRDIKILAQTPPVQAIIRAQSNNNFDPLEGNTLAVWENRLKDIFTAVLEANPNYFQLRYIGIAENGKELLRVEQHAGKITVTPNNQLQKKGNRDYFIETVALPPGTTRLSAINFNQEHSAIELPPTLTIRATTPVYTPDGRLFGMVVGNMDFGTYLEEVLAVIPSGVSTFVANNFGHTLVSEGNLYTPQNQEKQLIYEFFPDLSLRQFQKFKADTSGIKNRLEGIELQKISLHNRATYIAASNIFFDQTSPDRFLTLIYTFPESIITNSIKPLQKFLLSSFIATLLLIIFILIFFLKKAFTPLTTLADAAIEIAKGERNITLPKESAEEIAPLTSAFRFMLDSINRREKELQIAATVFDSHDAVMITDKQANILDVNDAFTRVTGYKKQEVLGKNPRILKSGRHAPEFFEDMWNNLIEKGSWQGELWDRHKNGEVYPKWVTISAVEDDTGEISNYVSIFSNISAVKAAQEEVLKLAYFDPLTNLANRRKLTEQLNHCLNESQRNGDYGALFFIDLDNFKTINDSLGHDVGDLILVDVAKMLQDQIEEAELIARLGGDEFVVIVQALNHNQSKATEKARQIGERIVTLLNQPHTLANKDYLCTGSVGIALFQGNSEDEQEILRQSDVAMYAAKQRGRNDLHFFDPVLQAALEERHKLETDLRDALDSDQFIPYLQKQVDKDGNIFGAEVLLRWNHPSRGQIAPLEFINICEDTGLIIPIGQRLLLAVCRKLSEWEKTYPSVPMNLSVNVSIKQFLDNGFIENLLNILEDTGIDSQQLTLEITETVAAESLDGLVNKLNRLRELNIKIAMDDFGTGYSSLSYFKNLPLDVIKIDQSFVRGLGKDAGDDYIVQVIINMGKTFGLEVVAEGVETEQQFNLLKQYGCHKFQGYFFAKPISMTEFEQQCLAKNSKQEHSKKTDQNNA